MIICKVDRSYLVDSVDNQSVMTIAKGEDLIQKILAHMSESVIGAIKNTSTGLYWMSLKLSYTRKIMHLRRMSKNWKNIKKFPNRSKSIMKISYPK